jgi:hypothetical protein
VGESISEQSYNHTSKFRNQDPILESCKFWSRLLGGSSCTFHSTESRLMMSQSSQGIGSIRENCQYKYMCICCVPMDDYYQFFWFFSHTYNTYTALYCRVRKYIILSSLPIVCALSLTALAPNSSVFLTSFGFLATGFLPHRLYFC